MLTNRVQDTHCPKCNRRINSATSFNDRVPVPNDYSMCISCLSMLRFDDELQLVEISDEQYFNDPEVTDENKMIVKNVRERIQLLKN